MREPLGGKATLGQIVDDDEEVERLAGIIEYRHPL
jgi:hypothetical protein